MGFGKAFGFSLLAYIGLNFLFVIITNTITGELNTLFGDIAANPLILFIILLGPVTETPTLVYVSIISGPFDAGVIVEYIGYIAAPLVAAIIAGKVGDNKAGSFLGWFITTILMAIILIMLVIFSILVGMTTFEVLILAAINGIFYGTFALLFTTTEYY
ncbi:MAG: hypothetical protein ACFFFB_08080 [Candidatus Heimdallarchaeota archaeon]